jgi:hypothetical protein
VTYGRLKSLPETLKSVFTILAQFPKLDVAGSNPVSRSIFSMVYSLDLVPEHHLKTWLKLIRFGPAEYCE